MTENAQTPQSEEFQIKGSSLVSKLEYLREVHGDAAELEAKKRLRDQGVYLLLVSDWYPYHLYTELNEAIVEEYLGGQLQRLQEVGEFSARRALETVYKIYLDQGDIEAFLRRLASLHERFFNIGTMEVRSAEGSCDILLTGAPVYPMVDMQVALGFYTGAARRFGIENPRCELTTGARSATYELRW